MEPVATLHVASPGDRWDLLAMRYYGSLAEVGRLVRANPTLPISAELPAGVEVVVPLVPEGEIAPAAVTLPPWKR